MDPKDSTPPGEDNSKRDATKVSVPNPNKLKMHDLSNEPPPGWWLQAYAKGIILPRELKVHCDDHQMIIFYDYEHEPVPEEHGNKYERKPHDKYLKFDWWAADMQKAKEKLEWRNYKRSKFYKGEKNPKQIVPSSF